LLTTIRRNTQDTCAALAWMYHPDDKPPITYAEFIAKVDRDADTESLKISRIQASRVCKVICDEFASRSHRERVARVEELARYGDAEGRRRNGSRAAFAKPTAS